MRLTLALAAIAVFAAPAALGAHIPRAIADLDPALLDKFKTQATFSVAASTIQKAVMKAGSEGAGFAGVEIAPTSDAVNLFWKSGVAIPTVVIEAIAAAKDVKINVQPATFSRDELMAVATALTPVLQNATNPFHSVSVNHRGSGLEIAGEVNTSDSAGRVADPQVTLEHAVGSTDIGELLKGVPFTVKPRKRPEQVARYNDVAPWEGGIAICSTNNKLCTAGFGVANEDDGQQYLLTAAHCKDDVWSACSGSPSNFRYDPSRYLGVVTHRQVDRDVMLIRVNNVKSAVWDGAIGSDFLKNVAWWEHAVYGESLCASGATTGITCGLTVTETWGYYCFDAVDCEWLALTSVAGGTTAIVGDSGGPLFRVLPDNNWSTVAMKGMVSFGGDAIIGFSLFSEAYNLWKVSEL